MIDSKSERRTQWAKNEVLSYPFGLQDLARFCLGDYIGGGEYRLVFDFDLIPNTVIKFCSANDCQANWVEYSIWQSVKNTKNAKWFCPVIDISPCGRFLLMEKARKIKDDEKLPKKVPNYFSDIKRSNFGFIGDRIVCTDYQFIGRAMDLAFCTNNRDANWD